MAIIFLGRLLPVASSGPPDAQTSNLISICLTLLRTRFTYQLWSPKAVGVSYTAFSPLPDFSGGLFSVALSRGLLRVGVTHRSALRSPDVPRRSSERRDRLANPPQYFQNRAKAVQALDIFIRGPGIERLIGSRICS